MCRQQAYLEISSQGTCCTEMGVDFALSGKPDNRGFHLASSITDLTNSQNIFELWFLIFFFLKILS